MGSVDRFPGMAGTRVGTAHYASKHAAMKHHPNAEHALEEGAIFIGPPEVPKGWKLVTQRCDGRYMLEYVGGENSGMDADLIVSLRAMVVDGNRMELPSGKHLANYAQVKSTLLKAGGRYRKNGFDFQEPARDIMDRLLGGEKVNDKKKYQFFETPAMLAGRMADLLDAEEDHRVLEPSAGRGALAGAVVSRGAFSDLVLVESMPQNCAVLRDLGYQVEERDFLECDAETLGGPFDRIIANPPFTRNQDIDHVRHMHSLLKPGGLMVSLASTSWITGTQRKQAVFREWLDEVGADMERIPPGTFKGSGTMVGAALLTIRRED